MRTVFLVLFVGSAGCKEREAPRATPMAAAAPARDPAIEVRRKAAVEALRAREPNLEFSGPACDVTAPTPPGQLGGMQLQFSGRGIGTEHPGDETYGYLLAYWRFTGSVFDVVAREGVAAPFEHEAFDDVKATLIIDRYIDPVFSDPVSPTRFTVGEIEGRVVLWHDGAAACGAKVRVQNSQVTVVHATNADYSVHNEDPLSKARIDLVNEALRAGLGMLRKPAPARPDCAHAPAAKVMVIDVRGAAAEKILDAKFLDDVGKLLAKEREQPEHRIWLFAGHTFDPWQRDSYESEIARWKAFLASHPAAKDEVVIDLRLVNNGVLVERLMDAGLDERTPAKVCAGGVERDVTDLARRATGIRAIVVASP